MTNETIPIAQAVANKKGTITGVITKQSDLKSGTTDGKDWTKKTFTISDESGSVDITAFNEQIQLFQLGFAYTVENGWWKEYQGKVGLQLGQYVKLHNLGPSTSKTVTVPEANQPQEEIKEMLPLLPDEISNLVEAKTILFLQVRNKVKSVFDKYFANVSGQEIGLATKEIFRKVSV